MADDHRNANRPTYQVGEANIQLALDKRLAQLTQLVETNPSLSSTEAARMEAYEVRVSTIASEQVPISFPGCLSKSSGTQYVRLALRSQQPHRQYLGSSAQTRTSI